jgi:hypothetical protein
LRTFYGASGYFWQKKAGTRPAFWGLRNQAIDTAINASNNIKTPPTKGKTMGIMGTIASTASTSWVAAVWGVGADIRFLKLNNGCFHGF